MPYRGSFGDGDECVIGANRWSEFRSGGFNLMTGRRRRVRAVLVPVVIFRNLSLSQ
jgi:hypothetical protein